MNSIATFYIEKIQNESREHCVADSLIDISNR